MTSDDALAADDPTTATASANCTVPAPDRVQSGESAAFVQTGLPEPGRVVARFAYQTRYYTSYCAVLAAVFVGSFVPGLGPVAAGLKDGAEAARKYVGETLASSEGRKRQMLESVVSPAVL